MGRVIEGTAHRSCDSALEKESEMNKREDAGLTVSYDAGWSKRGTGRNYNSSTGHGAFIGAKSKKILDFSVRNKHCNICALSKTRGRAPHPHRCTANWRGSSKAMEPDMAVSMIQNLSDKGHNVKTLVMDNDATTIAKVREIDSSIRKLSDNNHTKKSISNALYNLANTHKELKNKKTLNYIHRMFCYAIGQNQEDQEGLRRRLSEIVPHMFGDHGLCSSWCTYHKDPNSYKYHSLPYKKPLSNPALKCALEKLTKQL